MNPIDALFQRLRSQKRKAFIPFVTAGDPDLDATELLVAARRAQEDVVVINFSGRGDKDCFEGARLQGEEI